MSMVDVAMDAVHEPYLKHKDKLSAKSVGEIVGKATFFIAKPAVSAYDGFRKGFNGKEPEEKESGSMEASE
jgi:hypothetical protein